MYVSVCVLAIVKAVNAGQTQTHTTYFREPCFVSFWDVAFCGCV